MEPRVLSQRPRLGETLVAELALERLLALVTANVRLVGLHVEEGLAAKLAPVRPVAGVAF